MLTVVLLESKPLLYVIPTTFMHAFRWSTIDRASFFFYFYQLELYPVYLLDDIQERLEADPLLEVFAVLDPLLQPHDESVVTSTRQETRRKMRRE